MSWFKSRKNRKPTPKAPTVPVEPTFTQGHRQTLGFVVQLLETLQDKQRDHYIDDVLELHIGHLTDIYIHVVTHLKQSSERANDKSQARSCPTSE